MGYNMMVIDRRERFVKVKDFTAWYDKTTLWDEPLDYNDSAHSTPRLQAWYEQMRATVPPLDGPYASEDDVAADYTIARDAIFVDMPWEYAEEQRTVAWRLAMQCGLAFFDISDTNCLYYPDGWKLLCTKKQMQTEEAEDEYNRKQKLLVNVFKVCFIVLFFLCVSIFTGGKKLNIFQIIVELITFAVIGIDIWLLLRAKKKYEKRLTEIEEGTAQQSGIKVYYPTFDILDDPLKAIIHDIPATRLILYEYIQEKNISRSWKEWAFSMMEARYGTYGIVQLAGEDLSMNPFEFKALADQIFDELGISVSPKMAYEQYVLWIANQVDKGEMSAKEGFDLLTKAAVDSEYDDTFMPIYHLNDLLDMQSDIDGYSDDEIEKKRKDVFMNYLLQNAAQFP